MPKPKRPEGTPVEQVGDDVGPSYRGGQPGDGGSDAKSENIGSDMEEAGTTARDSNPERSVDEANQTLP